jgi:hypothetical protein
VQFSETPSVAFLILSGEQRGPADAVAAQRAATALTIMVA